MDFLTELNTAQRKAVEQIDGPVMVIAGAGSGKTRVLTYRIAHMMNSGIDPFNILALTFTNKAAREMKNRIGKIVGHSEAKNLWMGTFHSVFSRMLRAEAELLGYPSNFTIYDSTDSKSLIKRIIKEMKLDDKVYKPNIVQNRISAAKNNLLTAKAYSNNADIQSDDHKSRKPFLGKIYETYEKRCFQAGAMDFDDLLFRTYILLKKFPDILHKYQERFRYILVDEFQDTNYAQALILKMLAARYENICVVGDDAQSIYAFRGANIQNILNFQSQYTDAKSFKLEQNYRSTRTIVEAANSLIKKNKEQLDKDVWTDNDTGDSIKLFKAVSDNEEATLVAREIFDLTSGGDAGFDDIAILYRTNSQSRSLEEAFRKKDFPYKIYGGLSFYQRKEIKDLLSYFRLTINPKDEEALKRVINLPKRGLGQTTVDKLSITAAKHNVSIWEVIGQPDQYPCPLNKGTWTKLKEFLQMIESYQAATQRENAYDAATHIASTSGLLKELYADKTVEGVARYENLQELLSGIKEFCENDEVPETKEDMNRISDRTLGSYMQDIALLTDRDEEKDEGKPTITLMTIHASKGLEFPYVFIVGLEENLFPSQLSVNSRTELEEERRLFYVAITRAEKKAYLSYADSRYRWGNLVYAEPSRFIEEIEPKYIEQNVEEASLPDSNPNLRQRGWQMKSQKNKPTQRPAPAPKNLKRVTNTSPPDSNSPALKVSSGDQVLHQRFGQGKVLQVEGAGQNKKATIFFQNVGQKQLLLKFAKLEVLDS